ncbi:MAG TPA: hypothetical protein VGF71_08140 [Caulobacteraceae bacterium]
MIDPAQLSSPTAQREWVDGTARQFSAGVDGPACVAVIYGVVELFRHGLALSGLPSTYLPLLGGAAVIASLPIHLHTAKAPDGRSWALAAGSLAIFVPYLFSLYLMGFFGVWAIYRALTAHPFALGHALAGAFWLVVGWFMLSQLHRYQTHLINARKAGWI